MRSSGRVLQLDIPTSRVLGFVDNKSYLQLRLHVVNFGWKEDSILTGKKTKRRNCTQRDVAIDQICGIEPVCLVSVMTKELVAERRT